ncbi:Phosphatidylinositol-specific phospholipase C, X domain [Sesbania bispinosa]|nr:Phosphatidylinositol-specific phospholipase C, X domain [Sesbania bispinosa]
MAKTRGAPPRRGAESSSQPVERVRPTASARQRRLRREVQEIQEDVVPDVDEEEVPTDDEAHQGDPVDIQAEVYGGGPEDTSVLRTYHRHVALRLWNGEDRGTLKLVSHGRKLTAPVDAYIKDIVVNSGLAPLIDCSHSLVDRGLLSAFAERWHRDTCSFHLPVGEMTITLDDVSSLLHLPVTGRLFSLRTIGKDEANMMLVSLLRVSHVVAFVETEITRGAYVRLGWLRDLYAHSVQQGNLDVATRAYLLHLVGCTIFADKSATLVWVSYLELFRDLHMVGTFAWGASALAFLYENLKDASFHNTRQIAGYLTLLQAWIYEHFPHIVIHQPNSECEEGETLSKRCAPLRGTGDVAVVRQALDRLTYADVIWMPYEAHRVHRPFHDVSWYRGHITYGSIVFPHLPERVLRQYGHIQSIPPSPHDAFPVSGISDIHYQFLHYEDHLLEDVYRGPQMTIQGECVDDYLRWYHPISHPYLIPSDDRVANPVPRRVPRVDTVGSTSDGVGHVIRYQGLFQGISERLQALFDRGLVTHGTETGKLTQEALDMANLGVEGHRTGKPSYRHVYRRRGDRSTQ